MTVNKKRFFIIGLLMGVIILMLSIIFKSSPSVQANFDRAKLVEVLPLHKQFVAPEIKAFGRVEPKNIWKGIAEVNGKITYRHAQLETGRMIKAGTLVLSIDPLQYELQIAQAEASLNATKTQLKRLIQQEKNIQLSLEIEQKKLALINQEYTRKQTLKQKGLLSLSDVETQKQVSLVQSNLVQELISTLKLMPDDKRVIESEITVNEAQLKDANRQFQNTQFRLPFDARIAQVNIQTAQAVSTGSILFEAHQIGTVEIKAALSLQDAQLLMQSITQTKSEPGFLSIEQLNLPAKVELTLGAKTHIWPAQVMRISETINPDQATIGFYLEAEQIFEQTGLLKKPPLTQGMFVTASISGFKSQQFLVPEKALHGDVIYIMDKDHRLQLRQVNILFRTQLGVAVEGALEENEQLVLNDLIPAIAGMTLKTHSSVSKEPTL
jgi:multidrug efflux pump subunit AcrA (membrane-fusion protein)